MKTIQPNQLKYQINDGGRSLAGYSGNAGDCVVRALAIALDASYINMHSHLNQMAWSMEKNQRSKSGAATGFYNTTLAQMMRKFKFKWVKKKSKSFSIPNKGTFIVAFPNHVCVVKNGTIHDTHNPFDELGNFVLGYWKVY